MYVCTYVCLYVCIMNVCMYVCTYVCTCVLCMYVHMYVCLHVHLWKLKILSFFDFRSQRYYTRSNNYSNNTDNYCAKLWDDYGLKRRNEEETDRCSSGISLACCQHGWWMRWLIFAVVFSLQLLLGLLRTFNRWQTAFAAIFSRSFFLRRRGLWNINSQHSARHTYVKPLLTVTCYYLICFSLLSNLREITN